MPGGTGTAKLFFAGWDEAGLGFSGQAKNGTSRDKTGSRDFCFILLKITIHRDGTGTQIEKNKQDGTWPVPFTSLVTYMSASFS